MNNQTTELAELHRIVEVGQALQRLEQNSDYQMVILDEVIARTLLEDSENTTSMDPDIRQQAIEAVQAVSYLKRRLRTIADDALDTVYELNETGDE
jgi:hypothetical protein